jgi:hypothetical protein
LTRTRTTPLWIASPIGVAWPELVVIAI